MKNWKFKRTQKEINLINELNEINDDIRLVRKNKKKHYQRNKEILSKKAREIQNDLTLLKEIRRENANEKYNEK